MRKLPKTTKLPPPGATSDKRAFTFLQLLNSHEFWHGLRAALNAIQEFWHD
jgi:hypothetical protein